MNYTIEDNVPLPNRQGVKGGISGVIRSLKPNQSFYCGDKKRTCLSSEAWRVGKETGAKFAVCQEGEGFRVFRTA